MCLGTQEKLFSWPGQGQELQQNSDHTEAESGIVRSFGILGGSRRVGLGGCGSWLWCSTIFVTHLFFMACPPRSTDGLPQSHLLYFLDSLVSDPHNFSLTMHHSPSGLFLSHDLSSAAGYFILLAFLSSDSGEKKSGWPRCCSVTVCGNQYWIWDLRSEVRLCSNPLGRLGWISYDITQAAWGFLFSPGTWHSSFPLEKNHDFIVEDMPFWKPYIGLCHSHDEWNNVIIHLPYSSLFHINLSTLHITQTDEEGVDVRLIKSTPYAKNSGMCSAFIT